MRYHGENDSEHMLTFYQLLDRVCVGEKEASAIQENGLELSRSSIVYNWKKSMRNKDRSAYLQALQFDNSFPIESEAVDLMAQGSG